ncbi:periplasmic aspartyl protease [Apilactobacillus ozensis DSM 23829 = JCM 17196]|uniref:Periplasmic aspartyl protease n=1 Tax=Apilactobacillus ozensis DSM 23829 = JCM 17196 TaxID=1423781 RepID=A0A0R2AMK9_9LACO|nr:S53 family peptidase [Apilactobacillus ozensis]KRM67930.1 periplasmic aspartyl protease [Apilactobacillus ozensis DSM 23829 = JCM 17196]
MYNKKKILLSYFSVILLFSSFSVSANAKTKKKKIRVNNKVKIASNKHTSKSNINLSIIMKPKSNIDKYIYKTTNPNSSYYHKYLNPKQFSYKYGLNKTKVNKFRQYLNKYKIKSNFYPGNLVLKINGSANNLQKAFKFKLVKASVNGEYVLKPNHKLTFPKNIKNNIVDYVGIDSSTKLKSNLITSKAASNSSGDKSNGPDKFINRYNLKPLYSNDNKGQGQSIDIISFAGLNKSAAKTYWDSMGIKTNPNRIHVYNTDNKSINNSDTLETTMDVQQAGAIAPKSNINVYLANPSIEGMVSNLASAISANKSGSIAISWGESESALKHDMNAGLISKKYNQILNILLQQAAAQGISVFAASGDYGAYDGLPNGYTNLSVDSPSSSPYVTATGATTLPSTTFNVKNERAWSNDYLYPYFNKNSSMFKNQYTWMKAYFAGTGGGFSDFNGLPNYQNVTGIGSYSANKLWESDGKYLYQLKSSKRISGTNKGRNVPDISANGDPSTGYSIYNDGVWQLGGGTSVVAPQIAGVNALMSNKLGKRIGFWNPQIYKVANQSGSPFTALDSTNENSNIYYTGQPGKLYNQSTGLGTVDFSSLYNKLK